MVRLIGCESSDFTELAAVVQSGGTVVFPTDTVYGLGANPTSETGVAKCFALKGRDEGKPVPVLFSGIAEVKKVVFMGARALLLAERFWPGALTLVLPLRKDASISKKVTDSKDGLAVRIPNHICSRMVIASCGGSLIGTSANLSGQKPSLKWNDPELLNFAERADFLVKSECGPSGLPSTIVDLSLGEQIRMIREGAIQSSEIFSYLEKTSRTAFSSRKSTS